MPKSGEQNNAFPFFLAWALQSTVQTQKPPTLAKGLLFAKN